MADRDLDLDAQLCFALYAASRAMVTAYQPLLEEMSVTYPQYLVLLVLWERDGVRVSQLGERLMLDSGTLTPLLKRLEAQGLVDRRRSSLDERVVEIHLTAAGRRLERRAGRVPKAMLNKICGAGASVSEIAALRQRLHALTQTLHGTRKEKRRRSHIDA